MFFQYLVKKVRQDRETPGQFLLVSHWLGNILSQHCQRSTTILEQVLFLLCFSIIQPFSSFLILHNNGHSQASLGVNVETAASPFSSFIPFSQDSAPAVKEPAAYICNYAIMQLCMVGQVLLQVLQRVCTRCTNFSSPKLFTKLQNISCKLNNNRILDAHNSSASIHSKSSFESKSSFGGSLWVTINQLHQQQI